VVRRAVRLEPAADLGQNPAGEAASAGSQASQAGWARERGGRLRGVPGTLEISHSGLCSPEGFLLGKKIILV